MASDRETLTAALNYIKHVGSNWTMRGEPHPQQWIVDGLEALLAARPEVDAPDRLTDADRLHWLARVELGIDEIGGIDLHERAGSHMCERLRGEIGEKDEPSEQDYLAAIRDGIHEAIYSTEPQPVSTKDEK